MDRSPCRLRLGKKSPIKWCPIDPNFYPQSRNPSSTIELQLPVIPLQLKATGRLWRSCRRCRSRSRSQRLTGPSFHRCGNPELRPSRRELLSCWPAVLQTPPVSSPVSCRLRRSDSSASLAPTPLFHPSPASFNGAPSCCARVPPSPPAGAPKPLVTPLTIKIKRSVPVRCFNLRSPIMKPALQIGSPLIKSQPSHSRSTITIRWGGYSFVCLNP
jgi:hypothetical protein